MLMEGLRVSLVPMLEGRSVHQSVSVGKDAWFRFDGLDGTISSR